MTDLTNHSLMIIFNGFTGEVLEDTRECARDGEIVKGVRCSYCANTKWRVQKIRNWQRCTRCGRTIPLQKEHDQRRPMVQFYEA